MKTKSNKEPLDKKTEKQSPKKSKTNVSEEKINRLKKELDEQKDKYLRLFAEFENYKKRSNKENINLIKTANEILLKNLLPIFDDLERGLDKSNNKKQSPKEIIDGFNLIYQKIKDILKQEGLKKIEVKKGMDLDVNFHEAVMQVKNDKLKDKIVDIVESGYMLNDKVIRYTKVIIGK